MSEQFFPATQVLTPPGAISNDDRVALLEAAWWNLQPGEPGWDQPLHAYCGFTEQQWQTRKLERGWR